MLDASSDNLSANTWAAILGGPFEAIGRCISESAADNSSQAEWMASAAQLTDGVIQLICRNLTVIAEHRDFSSTWLRTMDTLQVILSTMTLIAASLAFSNCSKLLSALTTLRDGKEGLVKPALQLWAKYHPAEIQQESRSNGHPSKESPNQEALASHAHVLVEAYKASPEAVSTFLTTQASILMESIERGILLCTHPPYTSDVKTMAPEQKEALDCLAILKALLDDQNQTPRYSGFLLKLLGLTLNIENGKAIHRQKKPAMSKSVQQPSFIVFASACVDNYRNLILEHAHDERLIQSLAVQDACQALSAIISTKYTKIPTNSSAPLWRVATVTAVILLEAVQKHVCHTNVSQDMSDFGDLAENITSVAVSVLGAGGLSNPPTPEHSQEAILEDETFDIEQFELFHKALVPVFQSTEQISEGACKQYAVVVFRASLLAKPWFYDIPDDLVNEPLKDLMRVRPGSVHRPVFAVRRQICYTALNALFELVQLPQSSKPSSGDHVEGKTSTRKLACAAAPYLILRLVHPLKTFLADQRLRSLTPPPMPQQTELHVILSKFVDFRSDGYAMQHMMNSLDNPNHERSGNLPVDQNAGVINDGKEHLRILYSMMLRVQKFWQGLPRLKGPGARAWQDDEPGKTIEQALENWQRVVAEGWGFEPFQ